MLPGSAAVPGKDSTGRPVLDGGPRRRLGDSRQSQPLRPELAVKVGQVGGEKLGRGAYRLEVEFALETPGERPSAAAREALLFVY